MCSSMARSHHTGLDCIGPLPWSTASIWYWPLSTLEGAVHNCRWDLTGIGLSKRCERMCILIPIIKHVHTFSYMIKHDHDLPLNCPRVFTILQTSLVEPWLNVSSRHISPLQLWGRAQEDEDGEPQKMPMEVGMSSRLFCLGHDFHGKITTSIFIKRTGPWTFAFWYKVPLWLPKTCE